MAGPKMVQTLLVENNESFMGKFRGHKNTEESRVSMEKGKEMWPKVADQHLNRLKDLQAKQLHHLYILDCVCILQTGAR